MGSVYRGSRLAPNLGTLDELTDVSTAGGATGDVLTRQANGTYALEPPTGGVVGGSTSEADLTVDYGMSPAASAATNKTQLELAMTEAAAGAFHLWMPPGVFNINPVTIAAFGYELRGAGRARTILKPAAGSVDFLTYDTAASVSGGSPTILRDFGINGVNMTGGRGIYFPVSTVSSASRPVFELRGLGGHDIWGTAVEFTCNGTIAQCVTDNLFFYSCTGIGYVLGSDQNHNMLLGYNFGYEGISATDKTSLQISNSKMWSCGTVTAARGYGLRLRGEGAGVVVDNFYAQDNFAGGALLELGGKFQLLGFVAENNSQSSAGTYSGLTMTDVHDCKVVFAGGDRLNNGPSTHQTHSLLVNNTSGTTNYGNDVWLTQAPTNSATLGALIDPASNLYGTRVRAGAGGASSQQAVTVGSGVVAALDPYKAENFQIPVAANITTVPAPANKHRGCRIKLTFIASGTFNVTGGWNSVYKGTAAIPTTGGANGKFMSCVFESDGTNWYLENAPSWQA